MNSLANFILAEHGVLKLYFRIPSLKFVPQFGISDAYAAVDQGAQFTRQNKIFLHFLELRNGQVVALQEIFVSFPADKCAIGKENSGKLAMLQFIGELLISGPEADSLRLRHHNLLVNQLFGCARGEKR